MRCIILSVALIVYTEAGSHHWKSREEFGPGQPPFFMIQPHHCDSKIQIPCGPQRKNDSLYMKHQVPIKTCLKPPMHFKYGTKYRIFSIGVVIIENYGLSDAFIKPIHLPTIVNITDVPKVHALNGTVRSSEELLTSSESISSKNSGNETLGNV
ncbi:unnamed protein product [Timema podura]|uniref:Uncharacterized protein n=1 Tax=Timema podura TaxID=61482 RepID=A0ABN7NFP6_TIMPD|nr:unnamed protein product [Timema podura]